MIKKNWSKYDCELTHQFEMKNSVLHTDMQSLVWVGYGPDIIVVIPF